MGHYECGDLCKTEYYLDHTSPEGILLVLPAEKGPMRYTCMNEECNDVDVRKFCCKLWNNWEFQKWFSREIASEKPVSVYDAFKRFIKSEHFDKILKLCPGLLKVKYHDNDLLSLRVRNRLSTFTKTLTIE